MRKYIEVTGKTEEQAIASALAKLGLSRDEISVEVLELARTGFLGIGGSPAKIKVGYDVPDEPAAPVTIFQKPREEAPRRVEVPSAPKQTEKPKPQPEKKQTEKKQPEKKQAEMKKPEPAPAPKVTAVEVENDPRAARIGEFLTGLMERMEVRAVPRIQVDQEGNYLVELVGDNLGAVIGRRGETLDAIQQLTGYMLNRGESKRIRVRIDAEGYRSKREESLEKLARRTADKVVRFRRNMTLEPMNAYERHVVHTALQNYPDVTTYSVGSEPNRRTVISYAPGEHR